MLNRKVRVQNPQLFIAETVSINLRKTICISICILYSLYFYSQEDKDVLLIYGTQKYEYSVARKIVADKWNVEIIQVAGSIVEKRLLDSIRTENSKLWANLEKSIPKAEEKFLKEVSKTLAPIWNSMAVIDSDKRIQKKLKRYQTDSTHTSIEFNRINESGNPIWTVRQIDLLDYSSKSTDLFDLVVDCEKVNVKILE